MTGSYKHVYGAEAREVFCYLHSDGLEWASDGGAQRAAADRQHTRGERRDAMDVHGVQGHHANKPTNACSNICTICTADDCAECGADLDTKSKQKMGLH